MTNDDDGGGEGVSIPPKNDDVIYEQPLKLKLIHGFCEMKFCKSGEDGKSKLEKTTEFWGCLQARM